MNEPILIVGGAGYIGSHIVQQLQAAHEKTIVLDNLSTGFVEAIPNSELVIADCGDQALTGQLIKKHQIKTVIHLAAHTQVAESLLNPLKYFNNNTLKTYQLFECCATHGVKNVIYSSTAAVYGIPSTNNVDEESELRPINPYGSSKLMGEMFLREIAKATGLKAVILRYFNVAGANVSGLIGPLSKNSTTLIKIIAEVVAGKRDFIEIFGTDYDTADGTCVRDYIHVDDIAAAHLNAMSYLREGGDSVTLNCGYGKGFSVREVITAAQIVSGKAIKVVESARRAGDPPCVIAQAKQIKKLLSWMPSFDNLDTIVRSAIEWEIKQR